MSAGHSLVVRRQTLLRASERRSRLDCGQLDDRSSEDAPRGGTLAGLAAVVIVSVPEIGTVDLLSFGDDTDALALGVGGALIFFSFIGFEDLVKLAEETEDAERTLPTGILISAAIVLAVYLMIAVAAISALGPDQLSESPGPLAEIMQVQVGGAWATVIVVVALFATSKTILSNILGASRLAFDVARDTDLPLLERLARVNDATRTPLIAVVGVTLLAVMFGAIGDLEMVASMSNVLIMLVFLAVNAALLKVRRDTRHTDERPVFMIKGSVGPYPVVTMLAITGILILLTLNLVALFGPGVA